MSSITNKASVNELSKSSFVAKLLFSHGTNKREFYKTGTTKGEAIMAIRALPEYQAKPVYFRLQ